MLTKEQADKISINENMAIARQDGEIVRAGELYKWAYRRIETWPELKKQRDELLEACKELVMNYERDAKAVKITGSPHVQYALSLGKQAVKNAE